MKNLARRARLRAYAKINLTLKVLGRRPDGYHEIRTVYQTISLADELELEFIPGEPEHVEVDCSVPIPDNLVSRAAHAVLEAGGVKGVVRAKLVKRIPIGSGLGGGSSDAAAVLLALPVLAGVRLSASRLFRLAETLGSDVPLYLVGGTVLGVGRGEEVYPVPDLPQRWGVLVVPEKRIATAEAYRALDRDLTAGLEAFNMSSFRAFVASTVEGLPLDQWSALSENDFEPYVLQQVPELVELARRLREAGAPVTRVTGSGSAMYAIFAGRQQAQRSRELLGSCPAVVFQLLDRARYRRAFWRSLEAHMEGQTWPPRSRYVS